jgi:hypothetical protein
MTKLAGQDHGVRRRVDRAQDCATRGEQRPGGQRGAEVSVQPAARRDGEEDVHEGVDGREITDRALGDSEGMVGLQRDRREGQPQGLGGTDQ